MYILKIKNMQAGRVFKFIDYICMHTLVYNLKCESPKEYSHEEHKYTRNHTQNSKEKTN